MLEIVVRIEDIRKQYRFLMKRLAKGDTVRIIKAGETLVHLQRQRVGRRGKPRNRGADDFLKWIEEDLLSPAGSR